MKDFIARQNSERLRQRLSGTWKTREPAAFGKLARSVVEIALVTGVITRAYRAVVLTRPAAHDGTYLAISFIGGAVFVLLMASIHLSRHPLRDWAWRAPAFGALEGFFEMIFSLGLIATRREPLGTAAATFADWPGMAARTLFWRTLVVSLFAVALAVTVKIVRYRALRREHEAWSPGTVNSGLPGERIMARRARR